ncbi:5'-nucleotidase, lipoprotein e(P4) family [Paenibacillus doosanensis]|uniref:5'-nucleotidase, lipoprotein e(P4) family n=1 Tax=Paenibacillus doosanensis TaxID=1229154 RepID=UPI0035C7C1B5
MASLKSWKTLTTAVSAMVMAASLAACSAPEAVPGGGKEAAQPAAAAAEQPQSASGAESAAEAKFNAIAEQKVMAVLWYQSAAEAKALYYQGYNIGKWKLDAALAQGTAKKPAIVLDLDETVLDNSPFDAVEIASGKGHPYKWDEWVNKAEAKAVPGAVEFLNYADGKGVDIYYISDRSAAQTEATVKNLQAIQAPQAVSGHVLLKQPEEKGKEARFNQVSETHEIVLFFGDNLKDFYGFVGNSEQDRDRRADEVRQQFGDKLIVFPNPMYGDWESAIYNNNNKISAEEKDKLRKSHLHIFDK